MKLRCPTCGSKDLWQPRKKTSFDFILEKHGYDRYDCRNCWKRSIFRVNRQRQRDVPQPETETPSLVPQGKAAEPNAIARQVESTVIGATMLVSGEVFSREGMTVRGVLDGTVTMDNCRLFIEPGANVAANVDAGSVTVCRDAALTGQVKTGSFVLEDGGYFKGNVELTTQ